MIDEIEERTIRFKISYETRQARDDKGNLAFVKKTQ